MATTNQLRFIKEELASEFKSSSENDKWNLKHASSLILQRGDQGRINELSDLFYISEDNEFAGIKEFYWWYKDNQFSKEDSDLYKVYDAVSEEFGYDQCSPVHFSGKGKALYARINNWIGCGGNDSNDVLLEYLVAVLPQAYEFKPTLIVSPKSLLGTYGWSLFTQYIDKTYGSKHGYLNASDADIEKSKLAFKKLEEIQKARDDYLDKGNLTSYDKIGKMIVESGIEKTYQFVKSND